MDIIIDYQQRSTAAQQETDKYKKLSNTYSLYRLVLFSLFILAVCVAISIDEVVIIGFALVALLGCFSWLVKKQSHFDKLKNYYTDLKTVVDNEIASIQVQANIYDNGAIFSDDKHFYTSDLDIFGGNSLFQLINRCATFPGMIKLAGWLSAPASKTMIQSRQNAIKEIGQKNAWKLDIQAHLLFSVKQQKEQIKNLVSYLKIPVDLRGTQWLSRYSQVAPWLLLVLIVVGGFYTPVFYFIPVVGLINNRLVSSRSKEVDKADLIAGKIGITLDHFVLAFKSIEGEEWQAAYLKEIASKIKHPETAAVSEQILQLSKLINKLNYRLNLVVNTIMNVIFIWNIRQIIAIEKWKTDNQESLETAFDVIADFEALMSLASLHINYPQYCFPEVIQAETYTLTAKNLAHPLIKSDRRVENDYELTNSYKIDIITGSNMAGKSTFLRTVGINSVMALCGAPVCATEMRVCVMTMITYMRIKDSLNESTSTFKAELDRLQLLLAAVESETKVFFLIDEMLRGTNSVDKYLGSKAVIQQLIGKQGVGMVATHDLQIAELEAKHPTYVRNFYFDIQVVDGEMLFDYKIKHGECKTFNASLLLKQIGIVIEEE